MKKLYNESSLGVLAVGVAVLFSVFFLVHPRAKAFIPGRSQYQQSSFIQTIQQNKSVDAQKYWQFREFYSLGSFSFEPRVVTVGESLRLTALPENQSILLLFTSPKLKSTDYIVRRDDTLTETEQMTAVINEVISQNPTTTNIVFNDDRAILQQYEDQAYLLVFVKTIDEMKKVNGFFNYSANEQKLLENTFWLNVTHIN